MPTGTIGCAVLNIHDETITRLDAPCRILNQLLTGIGLKYVKVRQPAVRNGGEWGELWFDFENGTAEIVRLADWDTMKSNVFAKAAIRFVQDLPDGSKIAESYRLSI